MTASIGVYSYSSGLSEALFNESYWMSNRDILAQQLFDPVRQILTEVKEGRCAEYIGMERYRGWQELVDEEIGVWWDWPEWKEMKAAGWGVEWWWDELHCDGCSEWDVFCNDDILHEAPYALDPEVEIQHLVKWILSQNSAVHIDVQYIAVFIPGECRLYVLYSNRVEKRRPISWMNQRPDLRPEDVYCDAWEDEGEWPTFLLPRGVEEQAEAFDAQYEGEYDSTYERQAG